MITGYQQKNTWAKKIFIYPHGTWKDNKISVILDWRQRSAGRPDEGERSARLLSKRRNLWVTQANMSCVFSSCPTTSQKGSPRSNIKNINYNFIYLRVLPCLSSGSIYNIIKWFSTWYSAVWPTTVSTRITLVVFAINGHMWVGKFWNQQDI